MSTFNQGLTAVHSSVAGAGPSSLTHRSSLKTPNQVRWPVNLDQLAALTLEDDSDLDKSLTDISRDGIASVKLLKMLKDSDDETSLPVKGVKRLRRPRSTYENIHSGQQKHQLQQRIPVTRPSSLHYVPNSQSRNTSSGVSSNNSSSTNIPKPQRTRSDYKESVSTTVAPASKLRHYQSDMSLMATKRQSAGTADSSGNRTHITSEIPPLAHSLNRSLGTGSVSQGRNITSSGIRAPSIKSTSASGAISKPASGQDATSMLRRLSVGAHSSSSSTTSMSTMTAAGAVAQIKSRLSGPAKAAAPPHTSGTSNSTLTALGTKKATAPLQPSASSQSAPVSTSSTGIAHMESDNENSASTTFRELTEELDRLKTEAQEYRQERVAVESWRKQISDLERDLETALESLQSAEAMAAEAKAEQTGAGSQVAVLEKTVESLKTDLKTMKAQRDNALDEVSKAQHEKMEVLESRNQELEQKLAQAQQEIEQLELQVVPAELQDVHQALFTATQDLEETKQLCEKLKTELAEEKIKISREQEDSGQLLLKISQLQDTIANQLRDNNALRDLVKDHDKCKEDAEVIEYQHKKAMEQLQRDIATHQQGFTHEKEQRSALQQALQEHQYQAHQQQQQIQLQQTQLLQQQTEIVNLRATLEVEQKQAALVQQRFQDEQRIMNAHFVRRVSTDGELNGSFTMVDSTSTGGSGINVSGAGHMNHMGASADANMGVAMNMGMGMMTGQYHPLSTTMFSSASSMAPGRPNSPSLSLLTNQFSMGMSAPPLSSSVSAATSAAALPPNSASMISPTVGGLVMPSTSSASAITVGPMEIEPKPRMLHRGSSGSIVANTSINRHSFHGDSPGPMGGGGGNGLGAQLQADLSKVPTSGGGPMTRRKAEMLEEQMDDNERAISKIRYSIRMRS
ncbi:hypothetical protein BG011_004641 [Mortierella polycephala]|uniref:Uncharacterized protein n=1 Tax=Mortierella polycephala TaxID=41804 RepID=A0A9P6PZM4_9FUNG|nr:hypothetical protein BG011_004641 [Mortierella polycephala]